LYMEPGWAMNEEFKVKSPDNFDVKSAKRVLREQLDSVQKNRRYNRLRNGHRERNQKICGNWVVGSVREKEDPSQPSDI
jgi:hypothetical protein